MKEGIFEDQDFSTKSNYRNKSLECIWKSLRKLSTQWKRGKLHWNCAEQILSYTAMWSNISLKLHFLHSHMDFFSWVRGGRLRWTWWKIPSGNFPNLKGVQWEMESKYVGWPLLETYETPTGEYKRQKKMEWELLTVLYSGHRTYRHCSLCDTEYCN